MLCFWGAALDPAGEATAHPRPPSLSPRTFGARHIMPLFCQKICLPNLPPKKWTPWTIHYRQRTKVRRGDTEMLLWWRQKLEWLVMGVGGEPPSGKGVTREGSLANEGTSLRGMDNNFLFLWACVRYRQCVKVSLFYVWLNSTFFKKLPQFEKNKIWKLITFNKMKMRGITSEIN